MFGLNRMLTLICSICSHGWLKSRVAEWNLDGSRSIEGAQPAQATRLDRGRQRDQGTRHGISRAGVIGKQADVWILDSL